MNFVNCGFLRYNLALHSLHRATNYLIRNQQFNSHQIILSVVSYALISPELRCVKRDTL